VVKVSISEAVLPICKFHIAFYCSFISGFSFVEKVITRVEADIPVPRTTYFQTLFRIIITPNAP
jgi:hypothetical protein